MSKVSPAQIQTRTLDQKFRRRQFASLLLDQGFLSGIGNYLAQRNPFCGRHSPHLRPMDCQPYQIAAFAEAALAIPRQSYRHNGRDQRFRIGRSA